ncbi:hypothetical protein AnigIFM56816_007212 [Aspergillus niger]|nr:hypothetical protein AnigIFM56816_007212 [Aspergillus niger]
MPMFESLSNVLATMDPVQTLDVGHVIHYGFLGAGFELVEAALGLIRSVGIDYHGIDLLDDETKDLQAGHSLRHPRKITVREPFIEGIEKIFSLALVDPDLDLWIKDKVIIGAHEDMHL